MAAGLAEPGRGPPALDRCVAGGDDDPGNSNAWTEKTSETIHRLSLREAREENLDSIQRVAVDSTAVEAASCWPMDSRTVRDLCRRSLSTQSRLESLGWKCPSPHKCLERMEEVDRRHKDISMSGRGEYAAAERRSRCRDFFRVAFKLVTRLLQHHQSAQDWVGKADLLPLSREGAEAFATVLGEDTFNASKALQQSVERVEESRMTKTQERVLGVADRAAAIIAKGERELVFGYKPQLARSRSGLVTLPIVESGNSSESAKLAPMLRRSAANTGMFPSKLSVEDKYASARGLEEARDLGVAEVSIGGSEGRKRLGEEWELPSIRELRSWRDSVVSLVFVLNHG